MVILPPSPIDALDKTLLQLASWPPLTRLPADADLEALARVCALLSCKPTVGFLVPRVLGLPPERVRAALQVLHGWGHVHPLRSGFVQGGPVGLAEVGDPEPLAESSLFGKLWRRLVRR